LRAHFRNFAALTGVDNERRTAEMEIGVTQDFSLDSPRFKLSDQLNVALNETDSTGPWASMSAASDSLSWSRRQPGKIGLAH